MFGICLYMYFARKWALLFWALVVIILIRFRTSSFTSFKFSIYIPFHPEIFGAGMLSLFKQTVTRKTNNSLNVSPHLVIVLNFACYLVLVQAIWKTNIHLCSLESSVSRRLGPRVLLRWYSCHALLFTGGKYITEIVWCKVDWRTTSYYTQMPWFKMWYNENTR